MEIRRDSNSLKAASAPHESHHGIILWKKAGISSAFSPPKGGIVFYVFQLFTGAAFYAEHSASWQCTRPCTAASAAVSAGAPGAPKPVHSCGGYQRKGICQRDDGVYLTGGRIPVGLFTSPFLRDVREQIQCNGEMISPSSYMHLASRIAALGLPAESLPTEFELTATLAFLYFAEQKCDVVVLETGLGGAKDATNVIPAPLVAAITRIGLDHTQFLGNSLSDIAVHKAGILKKGCQAVCYPQASEAQQAIDAVCKQRQIPCAFPNFSELQIHSKGLDGQWFMYKGQGPYALSLLGPHQCKNAAMALEIIHCLRRQGFVIPESAIVQGPSQVQWPARLEVLCSTPLFLLDGGHNLQCIQAVCQALERCCKGRKSSAYLV